MFLTREIKTRISEEGYAKLQAILKRHPDKFENESHVVRAAIIRMYRETFDAEEAVSKQNPEEV